MYNDMYEELKGDVKVGENVTNKLLLDMVKSQRESFSNLIKVFIVTIVCYTLLLISGVVGFFWYESQFETVYELPNETITTTETITQETTGENSEINNVEGNMYKDSATHNEK